jgi:hypothetical protein
VNRADTVSASRRLLEDLVADRQPDLAPGLDPSLLRTHAREHGLSGLAGRAIEQGRLSLPGDVARGILEDWSEARRWAGILDLEIERVAHARASEPARQTSGRSLPILLKGPTVARRYRDPAVRPYVDIDVLVPAVELDGWGRLLSTLGYGGPGAWEERDARRYREHVVYHRPVAGRDLFFEVHWCLFTERRARRFDYGPLAGFTEPGPWPGLLQPTTDAHLVVLALHLVHHGREGRRLIWLRDFLEMGDRRAVDGARAIAEKAGVQWALERALFAVEGLIGHQAWSAAPPTGRQPFGLARVREVEGSGHLQHLATMWELGPMGGARYLFSRFDPRRFSRPGEGFDPSAVKAWTARLARVARTTPWLGRRER